MKPNLPIFTGKRIMRLMEKHPHLHKDQFVPVKNLNDFIDYELLHPSSNKRLLIRLGEKLKEEVLKTEGMEDVKFA